MRIKEIENQLLKENKHALQFLHHAKGFDFTAPYFIARQVGSFTWNKVNKTIAETLGDNYTAALLVRASAEKCCNRDLYYFDVCHGGKFDASHHKDLPGWEYKIDHCWGVGDAEELRKKQTAHYYIIAQRVDLLRWPEKKPVDMSQRFKLRLDAWSPGRAGDGRGNTYISRLKLSPTIGTGKPFEYQHERGHEQTNDLHIFSTTQAICPVRLKITSVRKNFVRFFVFIVKFPFKFGCIFIL